MLSNDSKKEIITLLDTAGYNVVSFSEQTVSLPAVTSTVPSTSTLSLQIVKRTE